MTIRILFSLVILLTLPFTQAQANDDGLNARDSFNQQCYQDVSFVKNIDKQEDTCRCVDLHLKLYVPERLLERQMSDLKEKHLHRLQKAASKSLIQCMDHFITDLFHDVCETAAFEHNIHANCSCMAEMGKLSLQQHRPGWLDEINRAEGPVDPQIIIGSDAVKADIAASMQACQ